MNPRAFRDFARGLIPLLISTFLQGCANVTVHGVIRTPTGDPVSDASLALTEPETGRLTARATSDLRGCFNVFEPVAPGDRPYVLHISAPGYKSLALTVRMNKTPLLLVTLVDDESPGESASRLIDFSERYARYDDACAPVGVPMR